MRNDRFYIEQKICENICLFEKETQKNLGSVEGFNHNRVLFKTNCQLEQYAIIDNDTPLIIKENTVYECGYDRERGTFFIVRERPDKTAPNTLRTAKLYGI